MKMSFTETDYKNRLSRPSKAVAGWENIVDYTQFLMFCPAQCKLGLSVQFLFFAEIARRPLAKQEGGNIQIQ